MSNTETLDITVDAITKFGVRSNGQNYSISKFSSAKPEDFVVGQTYSMKIYTGPKGGKSINEFTPIGTPKVAPIPPVPSLPKTTVGDTKAPGGEAPVRPAKWLNENGKGGLESERMTKADWAGKDRSIERQAILKSVLESPALAHLAVGKKKEEVLDLIGEVYTKALSLYDEAKAQ